MITWLKTYALHHLFYIVLIVVGVVAFHSWVQEHDARLLAEQQVKQSDAQVKTLQQQITTTTAQATQKAAVVTQIVKAAKTPTQQIAAVPQLTDAPLNVRTLPSLPDGVVAVDLAPLVAELGQCKTDSINLGACQENYKTCQDIVTTRETEIKVLKKKPNFWARIKAKGIDGVVGWVVVEGIRVILTHKA